VTDPAEAHSSRSRSRKPDERLLVLVVEDDVSLRTLLHGALERRGLQVVSVGVVGGVPNWPVCGQLSVVGSDGLCWIANVYVSDVGA